VDAERQGKSPPFSVHLWLPFIWNFYDGIHSYHALASSGHFASAQPIGWQSYEIPETGAKVDLPVTIFTKSAGQPESGYGRRFLSGDGRANLTVQSVANNTHDSPAAFLDKMHPPANIVYKRVTPDFFVVSSFRNDKIWYDRCNFAGRFTNCVLINYPAAEKRLWDGIVTRISNTLTAVSDVR
jgi:hypothetical protein